MRDGNVVVFSYAPGIVDEKTVSLANMERLLGFRLEKIAEPRYAQVAISSSTPWLKDSAGVTYGQGLWSPLYAATDPTVQVLGTYADTGKPGLVCKDFGSYKVVYSGAPLLPPGLWRDLGRLARAHVTCATNDAVYADGNFVGLHARTPGLKRLDLPRRADVYDLIHRRVIARNVSSIEVPMAGFDTVLLYRGEAARAEAFFAGLGGK
jgi:beta-galactosidase